MNKNQKHELDSLNVFRNLVAIIKPNLFWFVLAILLGIASVIIAIFSAETMKGITDSAITHNINSLKYGLLYVAVIFTLNIPVNILFTYSRERFSEYSTFGLRQKTVECVSRISIQHLEKQQKGDLISRFTNDLGLVQGLFGGSLIQIIIFPIQFTISLIYLLLFNWKLTLIILFPTPILMFFMNKLSRLLGKFFRQQQEILAEANNVVQDTASGITLVKSFLLENVMEVKFNKRIDEFVSKGIYISVVSGILIPLGQIMGIVPITITLGYGGFLVINIVMSIGSLYAYITLLNRLIDPVRNLPNTIISLKTSIVAFRRVLETWTMPLDENEGTDFGISSDYYAIEFKEVSFGYNPDSLILDNINLTLNAGEKVAFVGPSGCGKSTFLKLIAGFYEPSFGEICIYGHDIKDWRLLNLWNMISLVSQDTFLFSDTIYSNILYGKTGASEEDVVNAAKAADIHDFIMQLPEGYNSQVGEQGVMLSGGQRQRISIARAILKDAPILMLDEATSSLDTETEYNVQKALDTLMKGKTCLVVTHRASGIRNVDRAVAFKDGKIEEIQKEDVL